MKHSNWEIQVFFNSRLFWWTSNPTEPEQIGEFVVILSTQRLKLSNHHTTKALTIKHDTLMMCWPHLRKRGQTCGEKMYWWWREEIPCYRSHFGPNIPTPEHLRLRRRKLSCNDLKNTRICKKKRSRDLVLMEADNKEMWGRKRSRETFVMAPKHEAGRTILEWQVRAVACIPARFAMYWVLQQQWWSGRLLRPSDELVVP